MQTISNGRTYTLTTDPVLPALSADLKRRGWDGNTYTGVSLPTDRQRGAFRGVFYRDARTGGFEVVYCVRDAQEAA